MSLKTFFSHVSEDAIPSFYSKIYGSTDGDVFTVQGNDSFVMIHKSLTRDKKEITDCKTYFKKNDPSLIGAWYRRITISDAAESKERKMAA